jgi:outer membrane protein assembly factor BamB
VGAGSSGNTILLASPVVNKDRLFTLDTESNLKAFNSNNGSLIWEKNLNPVEDDAVYSGAITAGSKSIFVALGSGELICIGIKDGNEKWRVANKSPLRSAPTVSDGRLFVVTMDNKTLAFSIDTGELLWVHSGMTETAALLGGASPAVRENVVIVTYSSGEVFALKAETGRVFWGDHLGPNRRLTGVANIADIKGSPVINKSLVFIISHSGRLTAIDFKSGKRVWEKSIAGTNTPWIAGDYMFLVSNDGEVLCVSHTDGRIKWLSQMPKFESPDDQEGIIKYVGPILAGDRLLVVSSLGDIYSISPYVGTVLGKVNVGDSIFISPIIANKTMFVLNDKGLLTAFR